jgi:hypothetical protein
MTLGNNTCEICNKESDGYLQVCSSSIAAMSVAMCSECLRSGAEPYGVLVGVLMGCTKETTSPCLYDTIEATCKVNNKTEEEFWADCKEAEEDYIKYCEENND